MRINRKLGAVLIAGMFMTTLAPTTSATSPKPCDDPVVGLYGIVTYIVLTIINRIGYGEAALDNEKINGDEDEGNPNQYGDSMSGGDSSVVITGLQCLNPSDEED